MNRPGGYPRRGRALAAAAALLALGGCAVAPPFPPALTQQAHTVPAPDAVARNARVPTAPVAWGGTIVSVVNQAHDTLITVLAYPLDSEMRPRLRATTIGRFIVRAKGFVEPLIYAPGRELSVIGRVTGIEGGTIGQLPYNYPVVAPQSMHLWPLQPLQTSPRFQFGIGIGVGTRF